MDNFSIGVDIESINRIKTILRSKIGERFKDRIFTKAEIKYCDNKYNPYQHFAGRFAAKEAVKKAILSKGFNNITFKNIEILSNSIGSPLISLPKIYHFKYSFNCSISHSGDNALAFVLINKK